MRIMTKVQHNNKVLPIEKIISIFSYLTMGIVGLIWLLIAYFLKQKLKFFLMYNIAQSMVISIILSIITMGLDIILSILAKIPFLEYLAALVNCIFSIKILRISSLAFNIPELLIIILIGYIITGVIIGRIFYIPFLSDMMYKTMKHYN